MGFEYGFRGIALLFLELPVDYLFVRNKVGLVVAAVPFILFASVPSISIYDSIRLFDSFGISVWNKRLYPCN